MRGAAVIHARTLVLGAACVFAPAGLLLAKALAPEPLPAPRAEREATAASGELVPDTTRLLSGSDDEPITGLLLPRESAEVGASIAGRLIAVHVRMGDRVQQGQPIATLDARLADADVAAAQAAVRSQEVEQALAQNAEIAAREHQARVQALAAQGLASGEELVLATQDAERARLRARANASLLSQKAAQLQRLSLERHLMEVRAPFAGVIAARYLDPGAAVSVAGAQPIVRVISEELVLRVALPEKDAGRLQPGARLVATSPSGALRVSARVERVAAEIDPVARIWLVEASVERADDESTAREGTVTSGLEMRVELVEREAR